MPSDREQRQSNGAVRRRRVRRATVKGLVPAVLAVDSGVTCIPVFSVTVGHDDLTPCRRHRWYWRHPSAKTARRTQEDFNFEDLRRAAR